MQRVWLKRTLWMVVLWGGSVLALAAVSMGFRLLMTAAGLKAYSRATIWGRAMTALPRR